MKFKSLKNKLNLFGYKLLVMSVVAMVAMAITTGYILNKKSNRLLGEVISESLIAKGNFQLENISSQMVGLLEENSFSSIEQIYSSMLRNDSDFVSGNFIDSEGKKWLEIKSATKEVKLNIKESEIELPHDSIHFTELKTDSNKDVFLIVSDNYLLVSGFELFGQLTDEEIEMYYALTYLNRICVSKSENGKSTPYYWVI